MMNLSLYVHVLNQEELLFGLLREGTKYCCWYAVTGRSSTSSPRVLVLRIASIEEE